MKYKIAHNIKYIAFVPTVMKRDTFIKTKQKNFVYMYRKFCNFDNELTTTISWFYHGNIVQYMCTLTHFQFCIMNKF